MGQGESTGQLPFAVGEEIKTYQHPVWRLHEGTSKDAQAARKRVCIFVYSKSEGNAHLQPLALNALKRLRSLRYPKVLQFVEGAELPNGDVCIVVEECKPLDLNELSLTKNSAEITFGLYSVFNAISWLNNDAKMVHSNLTPAAIFVTPGGEWRVGGFEFLYAAMEGKASLERHTWPNSNFLNLLSNRYMSPELQGRNYKALAGAPTHSIDAWACGCFVYEVFNGTFQDATELARRGSIPVELYNGYKLLLSRNVLNRRNPKDLMQVPYFTLHPLIKASLFLDELALKSAESKDEFFMQFAKQVDDFPQNMCIYKLLPQLLAALQYGQSGSGSFASVLMSVLKIGTFLEKEQYAELVTPAVVQLFTSKERSVRIHLLEHLSRYAHHLSPELVNSKIFPCITSGFTDAHGPLRELSLKSLVSLVPMLRSTVVDGQVIELTVKMQSDAEPRIRTNAIYCLAKIAQHLSASTRDRVLATQFSQGLQDPFPHCRVAALVSIVATMDYHTAQRCARFIMPRVAPLCIDNVKEVRVQAIRCINAMATKFQAHSNEMDKKLQERLAEEKAKQMRQNGSSQAENTLENIGDALKAKEAVQAVESLGSWAISGLSKKLGYDGASAAEPDPSSGNKAQMSSVSSSSYPSSQTRPTKKQAPVKSAAKSKQDDDFDDFFSAMGNDDEVEETVSLSTARGKKKANNITKKKVTGSTRKGMSLKPTVTAAESRNNDDDMDAFFADFGVDESKSVVHTTPLRGKKASSRKPIVAKAEPEEDIMAGWGDFDVDTNEVDAPVVKTLTVKPKRVVNKVVPKSAAKKKPKPKIVAQPDDTDDIMAGWGDFGMTPAAKPAAAKPTPKRVTRPITKKNGLPAAKATPKATPKKKAVDPMDDWESFLK